MPRLSQNERVQAIAMLMQGQSQRDVARYFRVHESTIGRLKTRFNGTGSVADQARTGRPRVTTPRQDRAIRLAHLRNRHLTATETARQTLGTNNRTIHPKTVRNRLREVDLRARRPYVGLPLNDQRRARRMNWLRAHAQRVFPMRQWRRVLFTDESRFTLFRPDGRQRVYRRQGERFVDACVVERDRFGGGSIMIWGGIAHGLKTPLIVLRENLTGIRYRDQILQPVVVPFLQQHGLTLQQDNARPHVARVCQDLLAANNVQPLDWPPYSPDLSPIEHLWDELDRNVRNRPNIPRTLAQLAAALNEEWNNIPIRRINVLINSMPRRINAVREARGGHVRY